MFGHFLQSHEWEKYEQMEGHRTFWLEGEDYHALAVEKTTPVGKYLFCPYGPALERAKSVSGELVDLRRVLENLRAALGALRELARSERAIFVRVEPTFPVEIERREAADGDTEVTGEVLKAEDLKKLGLVKSHDIDPAHTWVVDLTQSAEELLAGTERDRVRHWRNHDKRGVKIYATKEPDDVKILTDLLGRLGEARKFTPQDTEHLRRQLEAGFATLYVAEYEGKPIAATLVHDYQGTRFVAHAAADDEYRKLRPGTSLALEAMMKFKEEGGREFDFWGITTSNNPKHPWYGFTQYKKSFDGRQVDYAGTWDLPVEKAKYKLYQGLRAVNRMKRKLR